MTDEQRARRNARARWRRKNNPESHAKELARQRSYRAKNREKYQAGAKSWKSAHPEYQREWRDRHPGYMKAWRKSHPEHKDKIMAWRKAHPENVKAWQKRHYEASREWEPLRQFLRREKERELFRIDAAAYAKHRESQRKQMAKQMAKAGKTYRGKPAQRIPDWAVKGQDLMRRSTMTVNALGNDLERAHRGYNNQLNRERYGND